MGQRLCPYLMGCYSSAKGLYSNVMPIHDRIEILLNIPGTLDEDALPIFLESEFRIETEPAVQTHLTYYDTFDWRLYRRSVVLFSDRQHLFLQSLKDHGVRLNAALPDPPKFAREFPQQRWRDFLTPILEIRALLPVVEFSLHRQAVKLLNRDQKTVARLFIEHVYLPLETAKPLRRVLRLQSLRGYEQAFEKAVSLLTSRGFNRESLPNWEYALQKLGRTPGDYSAKINVALQAEMPTEAALRELLLFLLSVIKRNEEGIIRDIDSEFLHDFRVAIRRTRSALSLMKNVFPAEKVEYFRKEFTRMAKATNSLRDLDVYLLRESQIRAMLPGELREYVDPLFDHIRGERKIARAYVKDKLREERYQKLILEWEAFLTGSGESDSLPDAHTTVKSFAGQHILKRFKQIVKTGKNIHADTPDTEFHQLRIKCKKLRYLLEFFASLYPAEVIKRLIKQLKKLQDNLGHFQDLCIQIEMLEQFGDTYPVHNNNDNKTLLSIGCLIGLLSAEKQSTKSRYEAVFTHFVSPQNRKLYQQLFS